MWKLGVTLCGLAGLLTSNVAAGAGSPAQLKVVPGQIHAGDRLYLSGGGLAPDTQYTLAVACPNWYTTSPNGLIIGMPGPRTDRRGQFVRFHVTAPAESATPTCEIYVTGGAATPASVKPAAFRIVPLGSPLPHCAATICMSVRAVRTISGSFLEVHGWPGAAVTAAITAASGPRESKKLSLSWEGVGRLRLRNALAEAATLLVRIDARLGRARGHLTAYVPLPPGAP